MKAASGPLAGRQPAHAVHATVRLVRFAPYALFGFDRTACSFSPDGAGFHRLIPEDQLFTGKDLTFPIEQDNSNIRHYLARFRRRSKVTSRAAHMVGSSLRLLHHLMQPTNFLACRDSFLSIFA